MQSFKSLSTAFSLTLLAAASPLCLAHEAGAKLEQEVGEYMVQLTYDTPAIKPGQSIEFHVALIEDHTSSNWHYAPFHSAWIQIKDSQGSAFRQVVNTTTTGVLTLQYPFPKEGDYTFSVRFLEREDTLAEAQFPLRVGTTESAEASSKNLVFFLFVLALAAILYVVWKRRQGERRHHKRSKR